MPHRLPPLPFSRAAWLRIAPFAAFMLLLGARGMAPADGSWGFDGRWLYAANLVVVGGLLAWWWRDYGELVPQLRPTARDWLLAVAVGAAVFWIWIRLDAPWMQLGDATAPFRPVDDAGRIMWPLLAVRWVGAVAVVPLMEELFWRSFLMRWIDNPQFERAPPQRVGIKAIVLSTFVFTLAHTLWLAAAIAGLAYATLYVRTGRLWVPVVAHAVTNALLGGWVMATGNWGYW